MNCAGRSRKTIGVPFLALGGLIPCVFAVAQTPGPSAPLLRDCSDPASVIAEIHPAVPVQVRFGVGGGSDACYAVRATVDGKEMEGYLLGSENPAIAAFLRGVQADVPAIPPAPPKAEPIPTGAQPNDARPAAPINFADLKAVDVSGRRIDLNAMRASYVILYFWSPSDKQSVTKSDDMESLNLSYQKRGVALVGVANTPSAARLRQISQQNEINWPQIADSGELAKKYHVDPEKPFMVLDRERNVTAAVSTSYELEPILQRLIEHR